ncbi:MAG: cysteine desulfurase [Treponema sp.]|nr:cysteine desulfurase [Treponema sp.]
MTETQSLHYFDWASTSPQDKDILRECLEITMEKWGNPSSAHAAGKEAKEILDQARKRAADVLGVKAENIYFTSGGTEADHIPLLSVLNSPHKGEVLFSSIEHPAIREMAKELQKCGWITKEIPCQKDGIINPESLKDMLNSDTALVCIMAVNNETGAIQPVKEIAQVIKNADVGKRKIKLHVDCVQALGKIPVNLKEWNVDSAAFSGHKISGPRGIGILYLKEAIEPFLKGGGQEKGIRSGTENLFGALAFSKVMEKYAIPENNSGLPVSSSSSRLEKHLAFKEISKNFVEKLSEIKGSTVIPQERLSNPENYSPYVVQAAFSNIPGQVLLRALDAEGFFISTGSACSSRKNNRPILEAMKVEPSLRENAVRFSFGHSTSEKALEDLLEKLKEINSLFNR